MHTLHTLRHSVILTGIISLSFIGIFAVVHAQESATISAQDDTESTTTEDRAILETASPTTETENVGANSVAAGRLSEGSQNRITNLSHNVTNRLNAALFRLDSIAERIETRTNKIIAEGIPVASTLDSVAQARVELEKSEAALSNIDVLVEAAITSDTPKERFVVVQNNFATAFTSIKRARVHLHAALNELRDRLQSDANKDSSTEAEPAEL